MSIGSLIHFYFQFLQLIVEEKCHEPHIFHILSNYDEDEEYAEMIQAFGGFNFRLTFHDPSDDILD